MFVFSVFISSILGVSWYHFYLRWKSGRPSSFNYKNGFALLPQKPYLFDDDDEVELFRNPIIKGEFMFNCLVCINQINFNACFKINNTTY